MTFSHGSLATLSVNSVSLTPYLNDVSLGEDIDTAETTVLNNTAKNYIPGLEDATFSCSGLYDPAFDVALVAMKRLVVPFVYRPVGAGTGKPELTGNVIMTSFTYGTTTDDAATLEAEFQVTGGVTRAVQP